MITLTSGTAFIMWLGEQITERGIGNGISLIIFSGIVVGLPSGLSNVLDLVRTDQFSILQVDLPAALIVIGAIAFVVYVERSQRRIPIQHARRGGGTALVGGHELLPAAREQRGRDPADLRLVAPDVPAHDPAVHRQRRRSRSFIDDWMNPGDFAYNAIYVALIVFFCFFYTAIVINPDDVSENIKRSGATSPASARARRRPSTSTACSRG